MPDRRARRRRLRYWWRRDPLPGPAAARGRGVVRVLASHGPVALGGPDRDRRDRVRGHGDRQTVGAAVRLAALLAATALAAPAPPADDDADTITDGGPPPTELPTPIPTAMTTEAPTPAPTVEATPEPTPVI